MSNNNNQISQPKTPNPDMQNLYQKIQEAARDRDWVKIKGLTEEIEKLEKEIKVEEEREAEEHQRRLQQFEEIIRRQKLKKLEEELEKTEERREKIKKEILKLTKKVNFNEDVEVRDTHTRDETPEIEKQEFIQVIGDRIEEEPTREELEKEFEEESNQLRKGFKINQERYLKLKELLEIIERPKVEDKWITKKKKQGRQKKIPFRKKIRLPLL